MTLDALARKLGIEPTSCAFKSLVQPAQMPFDNIAKKHFDCGDYPEALRRAIDAHRLRQGARAPKQRASRTAAGSASASPCTASRPATAPASTPPGASRSCRATSRAPRASPRRRAGARIGAHSHGQGLETTLSQVAHSILGVPHDRIRLDPWRHGETPYSTGTWGSRCMIMAGGAVAAACEQIADRVIAIGAEAAGGQNARTCGSRTARWWRHRPHLASPRLRARLVPPPAGPARRRRSGGPRSHRGLQGQARHRHLQLRGPRGERRGRPRDRRGRDPRLRDRRGRRHAGEPDDRRRPGVRRRGAGHRHRALRGDAASTRRASRSPPRSPTTCCRARPRCPRSASSTSRRLRPTPASARRASARAAPSPRPRRSPTRSTMR